MINKDGPKKDKKLTKDAVRPVLNNGEKIVKTRILADGVGAATGKDGWKFNPSCIEKASAKRQIAFMRISAISSGGKVVVVGVRIWE